MTEKISNVRVRFAPSPTGYLHVGGLRTALYNYLFARKHNGSFVLRIEDTDQSRQVAGAIENLVHSLHWAGLEYDEGPDISNGERGEHGPYKQSERLETYNTYAKQLVDNDKAYHCFCSEERLEKVRKQQKALKGASKYDKHCRKMSKTEQQERLEAGMPSVVRMKIPEKAGEMAFTDEVRGEVSIAYDILDDQILVKSDGFPTYHLANVVDDHLMDISHVIRGEEWLPSTPKHILLYNYFGWDVPVFAHLPLLLNEDRSKLSKRQGDVAVEDYREKGYLPEALVNFVALLGWNPGDEEEIFTLDKMIDRFSLDRINKSGAVFNVEKLQWMNGMYIREKQSEALFEIARPFLSTAGFDVSDTERMIKIVDAVKDNLRYLGEIAELTEVFLDQEVRFDESEQADIQEMLQKDSSNRVFQSLRDKFQEMDQVDKSTFLSTMKQVQKDTGVKGKDLWMPVRIALTGEMHGPELPAVVEILGRDLCIERLQKQIT